MSIKLISRAFDYKTSDAITKLILVKLADNANDDGQCFPSYAKMAEQCGVSRRTVIRKIKDLEIAGEIVIERRKTKNGNASNLFFLRCLIVAGGHPPSDTVSPNLVTCGHPPSGTASPITVSEPSTITVIEPIMSGKPDNAPPANAEATQLLEYLNTKAGRRFRPTAANLTPLKARLKEGYTPDDVRKVIDRKCAEWLHDPTMHQYLRPATLFNATKFASYAGQADSPLPQQGQYSQYSNAVRKPYVGIPAGDFSWMKGIEKIL